MLVVVEGELHEMSNPSCFRSTQLFPLCFATYSLVEVSFSSSAIQGSSIRSMALILAMAEAPCPASSPPLTMMGLLLLLLLLLSCYRSIASISVLSAATCLLWCSRWSPAPSAMRRTGVNSEHQRALACHIDLCLVGCRPLRLDIDVAPTTVVDSIVPHYCLLECDLRQLQLIPDSLSLLGGTTARKGVLSMLVAPF